MRLAYYPGCSLDATAVEYGTSTVRMASRLGIDLWEIPDWSCCGASSAHATDHLLALALPARNLALAEKEGLDVLAPCAACFNRMRAAEIAVRSSAHTREKIEKAINMEYQASMETVSILEMLVERYGILELSSRVTNPLKGMKPACYYGCLMVRPVEITGFDDPEHPQSMDRVMSALGASPVDWSYRSECCSAGLSVTKPEIGLQIIYNILENAREMGADSIVTACPICMLNLDMRQKAVGKKFKTRFNLPIYYVTELVAVACGDTPAEVGINRHFVEAGSLLTALPEKARAMEEEAKAKKAGSKKAGARGSKAEEKKSPSSPQDLKKDDQIPKKTSPVDLSRSDEEDNPARGLALKIYDDQEKATILMEILTRDQGRLEKLLVILEQDQAKAVKVADALLVKEAKRDDKLAGEEG